MINYIDIVVIVLILAFIIRGYSKGIFISLIELLRYVVGLPICFVLSDKYAQPVYESLVKPRALEMITEKVSNAKNTNEIIASIQETIDNLPSFISQLVELPKININQEDVAQQVLAKAFEPVLLSLTKGALFVVIFAVFFGITGLILSVFTHARKRKEDKYGKSVLSKTDRFIGAVFGICKSFVTIIALATVLMYIQDVGLFKDSTFLEQLQTSKMLEIVRNYNPLNFLLEVKK